MASHKEKKWDNLEMQWNALSVRQNASGPVGQDTSVVPRHTYVWSNQNKHPSFLE